MNDPIGWIFLVAVFVGSLAALTCYRHDSNVLHESRDVKKMSSRLIWRFLLMVVALYVGRWFGAGLVADTGAINIHLVIIGVAIGFNIVILLSEVIFTVLLRYLFLSRA